MNKLVSILLISLVLCSCMSRVPNTEKKARKKIGKILRTQKRLINQYPKLIDCTAIIIPEHTIDTVYETRVDTQYVDTLLHEYTGLHAALQNAYQHLFSLQDDSLANELTIDLTESRIDFLKRALNSKRDEVITTILPDTTFTYSDDIIKAEFIFKDGKFNPVITKLEQQIVAPTDYNCSIHFYEDFKFWVLMALVAAVFLFRWNQRRT